jgi:hypothetical protein
MTRRVSGITFNRYSQRQKIGMSTNLKVFEIKKTSLSRLATILTTANELYYTLVDRKVGVQTLGVHRSVGGKTLGVTSEWGTSFPSLQAKKKKMLFLFTTYPYGSFYRTFFDSMVNNFGFL